MTGRIGPVVQLTFEDKEPMRKCAIVRFVFSMKILFWDIPVYVIAFEIILLYKARMVERQKVTQIWAKLFKLSAMN